jgi:hypothetical protein
MTCPEELLLINQLSHRLNLSLALLWESGSSNHTEP